MMDVNVYLLQTLFLFLIIMPIVLKHTQFHLGFDALQTIVNDRRTYRSI